VKSKKSIYEQIKSSINFDELAGVKRLHNNIRIKKPSKGIFIRVHPDSKFHTQATLYTDPKDGMDYFVSKTMIQLFPTKVIPKTLYTSITRDGDLFLWAVRMKESLLRPNSWIDSAHKAALEAQTQWIRIESNQEQGVYNVYVAEGKIPEPQWPDIAVEDIIEQAFQDYFIDSEDHPIFKELRGLI